jgi:hypothetical protein
MTTNPVYDCSRLLVHVDTAEAEYAETRNHDTFPSFGHPEPPKLHLFRLSKSYQSRSALPVLVVAYTNHCVAAQVLVPDASDSAAIFYSTPMDICSLNIDTDEHMEGSSFQANVEEVITCLTVVALEDEKLQQSEQNNNDERENIMVVEGDPSSTVLIKGIFSDGSHKVHLAVVLGTSGSHLYSVDLSIDPESWMLQRLGSLPDDVPFLFEVLPIDGEVTAPRQVPSEERVPFQPKRGVTSFSTFRLDVGGKSATHVWIAYSDGTVVRLHHAGFFPSVFKRGAEQGLSLDDVLGCPVLLRYQVCLPPNEADLHVVPLPKHHPSLLSPLASMNLEWGGDQEKDVTKTPVGPPLEALVYGSQSSSDFFPAVVFYSSEVQFVDREEFEAGNDHLTESRVLGAVVGGTKALVGGMVGSAIGALRWGFGATLPAPAVGIDESTDSQDDAPATSPFPSLWSRPVELFAAHEFHDAPRQVEHCVIDPDGNYAAATDNLGRVLLFELATKQLIRLWKGYREASCHWVYKTDSFRVKPELHLVIHSRHRNIVESWSVQQDSRLSSVQVGRDAHILPCTLWSRSTLHSACYLIHSLLPGASPNLLELIDIGRDDPMVSTLRSEGNAVPTSSRIAALRLQRLQQLLSATSVELSTQDVYTALTEIQLGDLPTALDLIGGTNVLEEKCESGSEFYKAALAYCNHRLQGAVKVGDSEVSSNPHVKALSVKVQYHSQVSVSLLVSFDCLSFNCHVYSRIGYLRSSSRCLMSWSSSN